jgi:hypothetical protein
MIVGTIISAETITNAIDRTSAKSNVERDDR